MSEDSKTPSGRSRKSQNSQQTKTLKIEVNKFKSIVDALSGDKWWRIMLSVFFVGCILFTGIATVALAIKRLYPYSDITTNGLGATTFKSEKSEVSYWLYNTALLWASSGINVKKGDIISIRSSGKFNTALHHLYDNAKNNTIPEDEWIGPEGVIDDPAKHPGSYYRRKHRIFPGMPTGALVMQVVRNKPFDTPEDVNENHQFANPDDFYFIGGERENIYINNPGTLYFCVNDIIFNDRTIREMFVESIREKNSSFNPDAFLKKGLIVQSDRTTDDIAALAAEYQRVFDVDFRYLKRDRSAEIDRITIKRDSIICILQKQKRTQNNVDLYKLIKKIIAQELNDAAYAEDLFPERIEEKIRAVSYDISVEDSAHLYADFQELIDEMKATRAIGKMRLGITRIDRDSVISEIFQYHLGKEYHQAENKVYAEGYNSAWFDDNVGSFLIVIEKKHGDKQ